MELKDFRISQNLYRLQTGGAEKLAVQLAMSARETDHRFDFVFYASSGGGNLESELRDGELMYAFPDSETDDKRSILGAICSAFLTFRHARSFCLKHKVNLLHTHVGHSTELGMLLSWSLRIPFIVTLHSPQVIPLAIKEGSLKWRLRKFLLQLSLKRAALLIAVSEEVSNKALAFANGTILKPRVISNGILPPKQDSLRSVADLRSELGISQKSTVLLGVWRLVENKRPRVLVEMMAKLMARRKSGSDDETILLLVGDGPDRAHLEQKAKSFNVSKNILFLGDRSDVPDLLRGSDVFVSGSRFEGLSLAVLEAMALGKAIVSTPAPGTVEALSNHSGVVCSEHTAASLCDSLINVIDDEILFATIAKNAVSRFDMNYKIDNMTSRYLACYEQVLNEHTKN